MQKDNLSRIYGFLDNFIIQTTAAGNDYKSYVLIYFDDKISLSEYKSLLNKVKAHIFKKRKASAEQIIIIEGGLRNEAEIEFHILLKQSNPPAPNPTLPSPQFRRQG